MKKKLHWTNVYNNTRPEKTGWYQDNPLQSLQLIEATNLSKNANILNVGSGASTLVNTLLENGYNNIIVNDIAASALNVLKKCISAQNQSKVVFIEDDLTNPKGLLSIPKVDLWHDRAVLHFFLKEKEKESYFNLLKLKVKSKGFVIIAVFSLEGAKKCSGLELCRYDTNTIQERLGTDFKLIKDFNYLFMNPFGGERPYIYTLFQRN